MQPRPPKILFISHSAGRTGAPIGLLAFMQWLKRNTGAQMGTFLKSHGPLSPAFAELGPLVAQEPTILQRLGNRYKVLPRRLFNLKSNTSRIRKMLTENQYDLIYSNTFTNGNELEALSSFSVPVITHVHELEYWIQKSGPENFAKVCANSDSYIAASNAVRRYLLSFPILANAKISVVYEHIRDLPPTKTNDAKNAAYKKLRLPENAFVVGGCGAEFWRKGRDLVPQLLSKLRRAAPDLNIHFVWIGTPGSEHEEYTFYYDLKKCAVLPYFRTTGEVADPIELFAALDIFALLSRDDPYPLACLEAAATSIPVVCFDGAGGIPEFVASSCGLSSSYLDIDAMSDNILLLARDPERRNKIGENCRCRVASENLPHVTGPQLLRVIEEQLCLEG